MDTPGKGTPRRRVIAAGGALAGAMLANSLSRSTAEAHVGDGPIHGGSDTGAAAVEGHNSSNGPGVFGGSVGGPGVAGLHEGTAIGPGVVGTNTGNGAGVFGNAAAGPGVIGVSAAGPGVKGDSTNGRGVWGASVTGQGVFGEHLSPTAIGGGVVGQNVGNGSGVFGHRNSSSGAGAGVLGLSGGSGAGVEGMASGNEAGVRALSGSVPVLGGPVVLDCALALEAVGHTVLRLPSPLELPPGAACGGPALHVEGAVSMPGPLQMYVGSGSIPAGHGALAVSEPRAGLGSHIAVTLVGQPNRAPQQQAGVSWIERAVGAFTIHLTRRTDSATPFTYTVIGPA